MKLSNYWLSRRILVPVTVATLTLLLLALLLFTLMIRHQAYHELDRSLEAARQYWAIDKKHHINKLEGVLVSMTHSPTLRAAMATGEREELQQSMEELYQELQILHGYDRLGFLDSQRRVLLRMHAPEIYGDRVETFTAEAAEGEMQLSSGIVLGRFGMALQAVMPIIENEQILGYVALGESLDHVLEHMDELFQLKHMVVIDKSYLERRGLVDTFSKLGEWEQLPRHLLWRSSTDQLPPDLLELLREERVEDLDGGRLIECDGCYLFTGTLALTDHQGEVFGHAIMMRDVTAERNALFNTILVVVVLGLVIALFLLWLLYRITHRAETEYDVMHSEAAEARRAWEDAFDAIREPIFLHDHEFRVVRANRAYAELAGMSFNEMIGRPYWEAFPKGEGPLPKCGSAMQTNASLKEGQGQEQEEEIRLPDGRFFISRAFYTTHPDGSFQYSVHVLEDMTKRQLIIDALNSSEAQYHDLFDNMLNGFALHEIILDDAGKPVDYRFVMVNPAFEKITGLKGEEVIGRTVMELLPNTELEWLERYGQVALTGKSTQFTLESKALKKVFDVAAFRPAAGQFAVVIQDQTELQRENRLRRILSASNQALIHATSEQQLLDDICRIINEQTSYPLAWVGFREEDERRTLRPIAAAGLGPDELNQLPDTWADSAEGSSAPAEAIRSGRPIFTHDVEQESGCEACRRLAARLGYHSVLAIPLKDGDETTFGALTIAAIQESAFTEDEISLLEELAGDIAYGIVSLRAEELRRAAEQERERVLLKLESSLDQTVMTMAHAMEIRDPYTAGHQTRVAQLATAIAREMALPADQVEAIHIAATIHDIGKIHIPAEILSKPGRLSANEFELIKEHSAVGYDLLKEIDFPWPIAKIVRQHHEKLDGSGYPDGISGDEIMLEARIITVADVMEAMVSHRPYRAGLPLELALSEIEEHKGIFYDPQAADACLRLFHEGRFEWQLPSWT